MHQSRHWMDDCTLCSVFDSPWLSKGVSSAPLLSPRFGSADWEETGMSLDWISVHTVGLLLNWWTIRTPTANPHPPDALHFSLALFSGHFPTDEGKQQIMTAKLRSEDWIQAEKHYSLPREGTINPFFRLSSHFFSSNFQPPLYTSYIILLYSLITLTLHFQFQ